MDSLTLDQLLVFTATVDEGSFSGASRVLHRTQSAVTYTIQKFEEQIGTHLFDRSAYRPTLTVAGQALLPRARRILAETNLLRGQAKAMARGLEAEVRLGVSEMIPIRCLVPTLTTFRSTFPNVTLRLVTGAFGLAESLASGELDLAVIPDINLPNSFERSLLTTTPLVAVAAPDHPLSKRGGMLGSDVLRNELQIVLTDRYQTINSPDQGVAALDSWRVTDLATKRGLLSAGLGWGSMPESLVREDIAQGKLVVLQVERWDGSDQLPHLDIVVAQCIDRPVGPAGTALIAALITDKNNLSLPASPL